LRKQDINGRNGAGDEIEQYSALHD
jgi:hypothetical protein